MESEKYSDIYQKMNHKLKSIQKDDKFEKLIQRRLTNSIDDYNDQAIFEQICFSIFTGGYKSSNLTNLWDKMKYEFDDFDVIKVNNYKDLTIEQIFEKFQSFKNFGKNIACIQNAEVFIQIQDEHGDFKTYIQNFDGFDKMVEDLKNKFNYLGSTTVYDFLREIGFDFAKPDVHLRRIMYRLGFLENDKDSHKNRSEIHSITKEFARIETTKVSVVDAVFWLYGSGSTEYVQYGICTEKPKCNECDLKKICENGPV